MEGELGRIGKVSTAEDAYNDCPTWRLALFALNNTATNIYMSIMGYISMYTTGIAGLMVTVVGFILTAMRMTIKEFFSFKTNEQSEAQRSYITWERSFTC